MYSIMLKVMFYGAMKTVGLP